MSLRCTTGHVLCQSASCKSAQALPTSRRSPAAQVNIAKATRHLSKQHHDALMKRLNVAVTRSSQRKVAASRFQLWALMALFKGDLGPGVGQPTAEEWETLAHDAHMCALLSTSPQVL